MKGRKTTANQPFLLYFTIKRLIFLLPLFSLILKKTTWVMVIKYQGYQAADQV